MAILPRAESVRLVEDRDMAGDVTVFHRFYERLARGAEEPIPSEIVEQVPAGEDPVKVWRVHRVMSARQLAEKTGRSPSYVSETLLQFTPDSVNPGELFRHAHSLPRQ